MELQWPLILFTSFLAASAGLFGAQGLYALRGEGKKTQLLALIVSLVLLVVGGIAVFLHLEHWERIFNGFGHITSGITQELIAIVAMFVVMVLFFVYIRRSEKDPEIPKWLAVLAIVVSLLLCVVMSHSYMMPSRPAWDSVFQVLSIVGAACALGASLMAFLTALQGEGGTSLPGGCASLLDKIRGGAVDEGDAGSDAAKGEASYNGKVAWVGAIVNAVLTCAYIVYLCTIGGAFTQVKYYFDPVGPTRGITDVAGVSAFSGDALPFTLAVIVLTIVSLVGAWLGRRDGKWGRWGWIIALAVLLAAICLRVVFYHLGVSMFAFYDA